MLMQRVTQAHIRPVQRLRPAAAPDARADGTLKTADLLLLVVEHERLAVQRGYALQRHFYGPGLWSAVVFVQDSEDDPDVAVVEVNGVCAPRALHLLTAVLVTQPDHAVHRLAGNRHRLAL